MSSLEKSLFSSFAHFLIDFLVFFFLLLSCLSSLYILNVNLLSDIWFAYIFSHSLGCFFIVLWFPFTCRRFLVDVVPYYLLWLLLPLLLVSNKKKSLSRIMAYPLFFLRLEVSGLQFKSNPFWDEHCQSVWPKFLVVFQTLGIIQAALFVLISSQEWRVCKDLSVSQRRGSHLVPKTGWSEAGP